MPFRTRLSSTRGTPLGLLGSSGSITPFEVGQVIAAHVDVESQRDEYGNPASPM